jgi:hypothetical protein
MRLVITSLYAIGILLILAIARGYLIVRKDLSKGNIKETFMDKLIEAN